MVYNIVVYHLRAPLPNQDSAPSNIRGDLRWICWRPFNENGSFKKIPCSPVDGKAIGATLDYAGEFANFDGALDSADRMGLGVSVVFTDDGVIGIDLDHAVIDGDIHPEVTNWLRFFSNTYAELSPSGTGIHILARGRISKAIGSLPLPGTDDTRVEVYSVGRHFTFTGQRVGTATTVEDAQLALDKLIAHLGAPTTAAGEAPRVERYTSAGARRKHQRNCSELRGAIPGTRNNKLNSTAYFAARAFAAGALPGDERSTKDEILEAARAAWGGEVPPSDVATATSGWSAGIQTPLTLSAGTDDSTVDDFNKRFFVVGNLGNRCRVCSYDPDPDLEGKHVLSPQTFGDFRNRFDNVKVPAGENAKGETIYKGQASYWLDHPDRRYYESVVFLPGVKTPPDQFNLWRGFTCEPKPGDCSLYLNHIRNVICRGNSQEAEWYVSQLAYWIQHPAQQGHVAIVHRGEEGTGKNTVVEGFGRLWGAHFLSISKTEHLAGRFNRHLLNCCVLHANEAFYAGAKQHASSLKSLITDAELEIEGKGLEVITVPNRLKLFISSNERWVVPAGVFARRFAVFDVSDEHREDFEYFKRLWNQMRNGGYEALLHLLLTQDVTRHNPRVAPQTSGLMKQKAQSLTGAEAAWYECLSRGEAPGQKTASGKLLMRTTELISWAEGQHRYRWDHLESDAISQVLRQLEIPKDDAGKRWRIPELHLARRDWDRLFFSGDWNELPQSSLNGPGREEWEVTE